MATNTNASDQVTLLTTEITDEEGDVSESELRREFQTEDDDENDEDQSKTTTKLRLVFLCIASFGMAFSTYLFSVAIVPAQVRALVGDQKKSLYLGLVLASGGVVSVILSPLLGSFSDRLRSKFGKRTPFMVVGTIVFSIVIFGMAATAPLPKQCNQINSTNTTGSCYHPPGPKPLCHNHNTTKCILPKKITQYAFYFISYTVASAAYAVVSVAWNGLVADVTPQRLRGFGSGLNGLAFLLGNALGALWNIFLTAIDVWPTYIAMSIIFSLSCVVTIFGVKERAKFSSSKKAEKLTAKNAFVSFWRPLKEHDFRWVFLTRFFMQMGLYTIVGYIYYFFLDVVNLPKCMSPEQATGFGLLPLLLAGGAAGTFTGWLSDRLQRRRVFVFAAGLIMALLVGGLFTWTQSGVLSFLGLTVLGIGYGLYVSVDFALLLDVLPDKTTMANDIAVWHQSLLLPQFLASPIAGVIIDNLQESYCHIALGYRVVLVITFFYFALSGLFVWKVKSVK